MPAEEVEGTKLERVPDRDEKLEKELIEKSRVPGEPMKKVERIREVTIPS